MAVMDEIPRPASNREVWDEKPDSSEEQGNVLWPEAPGVTGQILPINRDPSGGLHPAWPGFVHDVVNSGYNALVGPGEVLTGQTPTGDAAHPNPYQIAQDITGTGLGLAAGRPAMAGESLGIFGGLRSTKPDLIARKAAVAAEKTGADPKEIFSDTGWFRDKDQNWKFEIPDTNSKLTINPEHIDDFDGKIVPAMWGGGPGKSNQKLGEILDHPELYQQYPWLKDLKVSGGAGEGSAFYYSDWRGKPLISMGKATPEEFRSNLHHEIQHAVQDKEGFAKGGNIDEFLPYNFYKNIYAIRDQAWDAAPEAAHAAGLSEDDLGRIFAARVKQIWGNAQPIHNDLMDYHLKNGDFDSPEMKKFLAHVEEFGQYDVGNKKPAVEKYMNLAGEVEARNVQERLAQGVSGDKGVFPWETQSYPWDVQQGVRFGKAPWQQESAKGHQFEPVQHNPFPFELESVEHDPFAEGAKP